VTGIPGETAFVEVATTFATGLHQVDSPAFDADGNLYVTYSGTRGQQVPVSIFRVLPNGTRETFSSGIVNPTSMTVGPDGALYVSSRFEGIVYRFDTEGTARPFATELGVACGLAFSLDGSLFVGDRSGTIFKVDPSGKAKPFVSLPASVAAFHLAVAPDGVLVVTGPTLSPRDGVYEIDPAGHVTMHHAHFGRPQGVAFDASGALYVVEALAGLSGLYRLRPDEPSELVLAGPGLLGVAFNPSGGLVVCSSETAYRFARYDWNR
jgi:sugar lactone lactonase YvrE